MPKSDTIDAILNINPTAAPEFLSEFSNDDLHEYLRRLTSVSVRCRVDRAVESSAFDAWTATAKLPTRATPTQPASAKRRVE